MQKHPAITWRRLERFLEALQTQVVTARAPAEVWFCPEPHADALSAEASNNWTQVEPGFTWGPAYRVVWFQVRGELPADWEGAEAGLIAELGGERTLWLGDCPERGIDGPHAVMRFREPVGPPAPIRLTIQAYGSAHHARVWGEVPEDSDASQVFKECAFVRLDTDLERLNYDFLFALDLARALPDTDPAYATIVRALNDVCNHWSQGSANRIARARRLIKDALGSLPGEVKHTITAVGHAHLDTAWLWPLAVTHLKMAHTAANQLYNMDRYPHFVFAHSQACQYEWIEQEVPALFHKIQEAAERGQWEPVGSMWVEADCNLSGGEALVRQFLYGRRYFQSRFGRTTDDMWLPDVFGYAASLPQILEKFGIHYFLTQKMSWSQINRFPHNTFLWQGIDGTKVWTHFPPADTYIGNCRPEQLLASVKNHRDHGRSDHSLYLFGWGDGGGGPTEEHLELIQRARDCNMLPEIHVGRTALDFFRDAKKNSTDLATWSGELYLEMHRGTYTTQARNKRGNREAEFLIRDAEWLQALLSETYPQAELERIWKLILLNQFHDIIPGSSVPEVYEDSERDYDDIRKAARALITEALVQAAKRYDTTKMERPLALFANAPLRTQGAIPWSEETVPSSLQCGDERLPVQWIDDFGQPKLIFAVPSEALEAVTVADLSSLAPSTRSRLKVGSRRMENEEIAIRFDAFGNITSIQTLEDHPVEFIQLGKLGNLFQIFEDRPNFWDAWDIDPFAFETGMDLIKSESVEVVERGPVRVAIQVIKKFGNSTIRQVISLGPTPGVRFDTEIDWREDHKLLKVAFPLHVNTNRATYEIQFGHVERPTHQNTSWDVARFEVCAQKWVDVSEGGHGVALINSGKYGHDVQGNVLRMSLLRAPTAPDKHADRGVHRFSYVLLPHYDQVTHSDVVAAAYAHNAELRWAWAEAGQEGGRPPGQKLITVDTRHLMIESVKKAEDSAHLVVRLYECHNTRGSAELILATGAKRAWLADLNETLIQELEVSDGRVVFEYRPFEIITIVLER